MVDYKVVKPEIKVIDFGPKLDLGDGVVLGPDELIQFSGQVIYKNAQALRESIELARRNAVDLTRTKKSLANTTGRAHASMAAMAGGEFSIEGDSSKMGDSAFTGATFSNAHMTSGRRTNVGSEEEEIVVPASIYSAGGSVLEMYLEASRNHLEANKRLRDMGVEKQVAAKVLHYGIRGGGSIKLSVETIADFARFQMGQPLPVECKEMILQLEQACRENGAPVLLEARKRAPRICYPNTSIFREDDENEATELVGRLYESKGDPIPLRTNVPSSKALERRIREYVALIEESHKSIESFRDSKDRIYDMARAIAGDFPSVSVSIAEFVPWRVWGEDKRHRTVRQVVEPIYHARDRTEEFLFSSGELKGHDFDPEYLRLVLSMPGEIARDSERLKIWADRAEEGLSVSRRLIETGIDKSDAIYVVSRLIKLAMVKTYDLYNALTGGFVPLRMCSTAEPEMREITHKEAILLREMLPDYMHPLLNPKCYQLGCSEESKSFAKCKRVTSFMPWWDDAAHEQLNNERQEAIWAAVEGEQE